jgi:cell division protein FtsW
MNERNDLSIYGWILIFVTLALVSISLLMVYSVTSGQILSKFFHSRKALHGGLPNTSLFLIKQLIYIVLGIGVAFVTAFFTPEFYKSGVKVWLIIAVLLLIGVLLFGVNINGARRWFRLPGFSLQPMEVSKIAMILYLAVILEKRIHVLKEPWKGFGQPLMVTGFMIFLILLQPDLGSAILFIMVAITLLFLAGSKIYYFIMVALAGIPFLWYYVAAGWRLNKRIIPFLHPEQFKQGAAYQITRSLDAFGSGGVNGWGLGNGPYKMEFLPEAHTDYIAAMIGQELGFIGICFIIFLYAMFLFAGIKIALKNKQNLFRFLLSIGLTFMMVFQAIINLSVVMNLIPSKGITLPFISFGGSSMIISFVTLGILLSIDRYPVKEEVKIKKNKPKFIKIGVNSLETVRD